MAEILSQSEIDELLQQFQEGSLEPESLAQEVAPSPEQGVVIYDFRHPNRVTREQIRTLRVIHETFAKQAESYLSTRLRTMVTSKVEAIDQVTYAEFQLSLSDPSCICIVGAEEFKSDFVVEINPTLAFLAVDRLFGGTGNTVDEFREMSLIEQRVVRRLVEGLLRYYDQAWKPIYTVHTQLKTLHSRPSLTQIVAPGETVVAVSVGFMADDVAGAMNFCLPYLLLEDLLPGMSAGKVAFGSVVRKDENTRRVLEHNVRETRVPVSVMLGKTTITLRDLMGLQPGDVLVLNTHTDDTVPIYVGGERRAEGRPGLHRRNVAVRVEKVREPEF